MSRGSNNLNTDFTSLTRLPQSPDLNPVAHLCDVVELEVKSLMCSQHICTDCATLTCRLAMKSLKKVCSTLFESMAKRSLTLYLLKWLVSVYLFLYNIPYHWS